MWELCILWFSNTIYLQWLQFLQYINHYFKMQMFALFLNISGLTLILSAVVKNCLESEYSQILEKAIALTNDNVKWCAEAFSVGSWSCPAQQPHSTMTMRTLSFKPCTSRFIVIIIARQRKTSLAVALF